VFEPDYKDISLLFKKLVILPKDQEAEKEAPQAEISEIKAAENVESLEEPQETYLAQSPLEKHPFVIFTSAELKDLLKAQSSNFSKTISALGYHNCVKYIISEKSNLSDLLDYNCVWTIGLSPKLEQEILAIKHPNILLSPNMEALDTKEEKTAMWVSLKKFASLNSGLLSNL
jgi:hypothetical protein